MKRITNILSYLCLLLLLPVVACSDLEEIVVNMQGEEEVELTIQTNIPGLGGSTRTAPTENITSITALAFDSDHELIKVVTATLTNPQGTSGTLSVKVPLRTRRIHFIAKNNDVFDEITDDDYGKSDVDLLKDLLTTELHYWAMLQFDNADDLENLSDELAAEPNTDNKLTLIRNMAKVELTLPNGTSGYIAGFLNYNTEGTIAAYSGDDFQYLSAKTSTHYVPATHTSDDEDDGNADSKPSVEYMFEETNANGDYVYVICKIADLYYKIAFAYADSNGDPVYFPIVRNHSYTINIMDVSKITSYGEGYFEDAIDAAPINATAQEEVDFIFDYETIIMFIEDKTCEIFVTIPEGITKLKVLPPEEVFTIKSVSSELDPELDLGNDGLYTVTPGTNYTITLELNENHTETGRASVYFQGYGVGMIAHNDVEVKLRRKETITIYPSERTMNNTQGSYCYFDVTIPANIDNLVIEAADAFTITEVVHTSSSTPVTPKDDGSYTVTNATYRVTLSLKEEAIGQTGEYSIHFAGTSEYWGAEGTATITLQDYVLPDSDVYEIWVNNGTWEASDEYSVEFFGYEGTFVTGGQVLGNNFYDALTVNDVTYSADKHKQQAMVMGSDDSFTFTIPEDENESRWLTLLVANDGDDSDTPSIQLSNGSDWTTVTSSEDIVPDYYNFGTGEIGTAGRLIRYELKPGTYTLQGSNAADYLLYYMRVSKARPETTDVAQPQLVDYNLSWSGATYTNNAATGHLPIGDDNKKHIVDEDNLTHTVVLKAENSLTSSLNLSTSSALAGIDLVVETTRVAFASTDANTYNTTITTQEISAQSNSCSLTNYNAGNYALSGTINEPDYKYKAFYDKLHLDAVQYEVKSPIMPGLYTSMDGDKLTPVNEFSSLDEAWAIGFKLPMVIPDLNVTPDNYSIGINIPDWTKSGDGDATGLGVIVGENGNYTLGNQDDMIHPREGWTYKIKWASIAGDEIVPSLAGDKASDTDHYFIYDGTIAKSVEIPTPYTEQQLGVTLNFRSASENLGNDATYNLNFGNDFYLTAQISPEDAQNYAGKMVRLKVDFTNTQGGGNDAIHWSNSRNKDDSTIEYGNSDGTELQFEIKQGQTSYEIHWQFVRSNNETSLVQFTYTLSGQTVSGETSATVVLNSNGQAVDNPLDLNLDFYALNTNSLEVDNGVNGSYTDLLLGTSRFVLEVTIDDTDAQAYNGQTVYLAGNFETIAAGAAENGWAIHWVNSRTDGLINYYAQNDKINGSALQFKIDDSTSSYKIEWVFKTGGNYNGGEIGFDYKISTHANSPTKYNLSGDTQATIAFTNESQILVATNGNQASNNIYLSLEYGENSAEEFTVDVPVPDNVSGINISAPDYLTVSIGKLAAGEGYPEAAVPVNGNYTFTGSDETTAPRFKFKLNGTPTENTSVITFTSADGNASKATVTVNWAQRGAESNQTTIWSGAMDLQWTRNYLEATTNQLPAGTQVTLYFTTTGGQIKLHDSSETSISGDSGFAVTNGATQYSFTLQNAVNGLKINGNNVRMTSIVVSTPSAVTETVIFDCGFDVGLGSVSTRDESKVYVTDGALVLKNESALTNSWNAQARIQSNQFKNNQKYRLTFKIKFGDDALNNKLQFALTNDNNEHDNYVYLEYFNGYNGLTKEWQSFSHEFTTKIVATYFNINFGEFQGTLYIDDLKLVEVNE